jgi:metal transporter CNNM
MDQVIIIFLVVMSGLFSGLTIGLSSLSKDELARMAANGDVNAAKVLVVVKDYNLLLVTLLFGNTVVNAFLTNFLGQILNPGVMTVLLATFLILIFGEIAPSAVLNRHALTFGAKVTPLIQFLIYLFYPIAKPIAYVLNKLLGKDLKNIYTRDDFEYILDKHTTAEHSNIDELDNTLIKGTLSLNDTVAGSLTTKRRNVYYLKYDRIIDGALLDELTENSFSRIPVVNDNQVIGILKTKKLLNYNPYTETPQTVMEYTDSNKVLKFEASDKIDDILETMIETRVHIASINNSKNKWVGILTMEDILNKLFGTNIDDDDDEDDISDGDDEDDINEYMHKNEEH